MSSTSPREFSTEATYLNVMEVPKPAHSEQHFVLGVDRYFSPSSSMFARSSLVRLAYAELPLEVPGFCPRSLTIPH